MRVGRKHGCWLGMLALLAGAVGAQDGGHLWARPVGAGAPLSSRRLSPLLDAFPGTLMRDALGSGLAVLGDLDGNGVVDVAMGAEADHPLDECWQGSVWIQFLASNRDAIREVKIREGEGGFTGALDPDDRFGCDVAGIGDLNGDGIPDLAVGAPGDDDLRPGAGAVWILFLNADGTVQSHRKILPPVFDTAFSAQGIRRMRVKRFGFGLAGLGDLDGDGTTELAVGARRGDMHGEGSGAIWILSLQPNGNILRSTKISATAGGFSGLLDPHDLFGHTLALASDQDGNGVPDLLVGAPGDDDVRENAGAVWRLSLSAEGTVVGWSKISAFSNGLATLGFNNLFGEGIAEIGDLDGDGVPDLLVGAPGIGTGGTLWALFMNSDGTVKSVRQNVPPANDSQATFEGRGGWGASLAALGDLDGNGIPDALVASPGRRTPTTGWVWCLDLRVNGSIRSLHAYGTENWTEPNFVLSYGGSSFGAAVASLGDRDGDGGLELAVGQPNDNALWMVHLDADQNVTRVEKLSRNTGFPAGVAGGDQFGQALEVIGDLDGNGFEDLAVGAPGDEDGHVGGGGQFDYGAVWILFFGPGGSIIDVQEISGTQGGLSLGLSSESKFGAAIAAVGDLDGDGVIDLAVGAPGRHIGLASSGGVYVLFLNPDGTVKTATRFFSPSMTPNETRFGSALAAVGGGLAIGEPFLNGGLVWMTRLGPDGQPATAFQIGTGQGGFSGTIGSGVRFGSALARLPDLDGDRLEELAVAGPGYFDPLSNDRTGQVWVLLLDQNRMVHAQTSFGPEHPAIDVPANFGWALAPLEDVNGDEVPDLLVGSPDDLYFPGACETSRGTASIVTLIGTGLPRSAH